MDRGNHMLARAIVMAKGKAAEAEAELESVAMDEESFRIVYERTARPLWAYLARLSGDPALADDLLQECYCRFLALENPPQEEAHRKNYLFRIATNLFRDHRRAAQRHGETGLPTADIATQDRRVTNVPLRSDLGRALSRLQPRERQLLWLAYAEGASHREIAKVSGMKEVSVRPLLFRARKKLVALLGDISLETQKAGQ